jgi:hypothetical protein
MQTTTSPTTPPRDGTLRHLGTAALYTLVTVVLLGIVYPLAMTGIARRRQTGRLGYRRPALDQTAVFPRPAFGRR